MLEVPGSETSFESLTTVPGGDVWAAGGSSSGSSYDIPTVWRRSGSGWQQMTIPVDLAGRWGYMQGISGDAADDVWAVGHTTILSNGNPQPLVAHWNGTGWGVVGQPWRDPEATGSFSSVVATSPTDVWVGGTVNLGVNKPVVWHLTGVVWSQREVLVKSGICSVPTAIVSAIARTADGLYVAMNCPTMSTGYSGMVELWNGKRWKLVLKLPDRSFVRGMTSAPDGTVWATGYQAGVAGGGFARVWSGDADGLTQVDAPAVAATTGYAIAVGPGGDVIVVGEKSEIPGPAPFVMSLVRGTWGVESMRYDRGLSATTVGENGKVFAGGPTFGGWIGGTGPHATVLMRGAS